MLGSLRLATPKLPDCFKVLTPIQPCMQDGTQRETVLDWVLLAAVMAADRALLLADSELDSGLANGVRGWSEERKSAMIAALVAVRRLLAVMYATLARVPTIWQSVCPQVALLLHGVTELGGLPGAPPEWAAASGPLSPALLVACCCGSVQTASSSKCYSSPHWQDCPAYLLLDNRLPVHCLAVHIQAMLMWQCMVR